MRGRVVIVCLAVAAAACGGDDLEPLFPADYQDSYVEVRDCRGNGGSHDFNRIRVLADPLALVAYRDRSEPFPEGAVVLKEEYDADDADCTGAIRRWTVMQRRAAGDDAGIGWRWQEVDADGIVVNEDEPRCAGCHAGCAPPDGYEGTCTVP